MKSTLLIALLFLVSALLPAQEIQFGDSTTIQSDNAVYNGHELQLTGSVVVENALGKVTAERAVLRKDDLRRSKIDFPWLEIHDNVHVQLSDGRYLNCSKVVLDYLARTGLFTCESIDKPSDAKVYYRDTLGEIYSDAIKVEFSSEETGYKPTKITLIQRVQLINRKPPKEGAEPSVQYALADQVDYFPGDETMFLQAFDQRRVLFFDQQKNMQLSAKSIRAKRDQDGQETIQGMGDVKFTFAQDELQKLKDRFHLN